MKKYFQPISSLLVFLFFSLETYAQIPTDIPKPNENEPLDLSNPADIIIYIILPLLCIGLFLLWRARRRK